HVFGEIMGTPDNAIPNELLDRAEGVAVFPSVLKAGFIVGGRGGRGVASCRTQLIEFSAPSRVRTIQPFLESFFDKALFERRQPISLVRLYLLSVQSE